MACMFFSGFDGPGRSRFRWRSHAAWVVLLTVCLHVDAATSKALAAASAASAASAAAASAPKLAASVPDTALASLKSSSARIQFGKQQIGSSSPVQSLILSADPAAVATTVFEVHTSGDFTVLPAKCELAAKSSCALSVSFVPGKTGATSSAIVVSHVQGGPTRVVAELAGEGIGMCQARGLFPCTGWWTVMPVLFLAFLYWVAVIMARWNMVALPTRALLQAEIDAVRSRLVSLACTEAEPKACTAQVTTLLDRAKDCLSESYGPTWLMNVVFWSRGKEQAGWQLVHEAKEQMAALLPPEDLRVALEDAEVQLRQNAGTEAVALADQIHAELARTVWDVSDCTAALLAETSAFVTSVTRDVASDLAAVLRTQSGATTADMAGLASRLVAALAPQTALSARIEQILPTAVPCAYQSLLEHALVVFLPQAKRMHGLLNAATEANLSTCLDTFQKQFLPAAEAYRNRLEQALAAAPLPQSQRRASLLCEARNQLYDSSDVEFASIASWHKKTAWLVGSALLMIVILSATFGHATLFLLGALGGLLSRFSRVLVRQQLPTDYGFSWTTLFLSPMVGALAGWAGVLLLALAVKYKVLGDLFASVSWADPHSELVMGLAVVLGFSERLFVRIVEGVESKVGAGAGFAATADEAVATPQTTPASTPPVASPKAAKVEPSVVKSTLQAVQKRAETRIAPAPPNAGGG